MTSKQLPFGSWPSAITAERAARAGRKVLSVTVADDDVYWVETRPEEEGRYVVMRLDGEIVSDVTPPGFNVRTRVHEYGGGAYVAGGGTIWFSNYPDQRLWRQEPGGAPRPITPEPEVASALRYADGVMTPDGSAIVCIRESHSDEGEAVNEVVALDPAGSKDAAVLASGSDFYAFPRLSPDGGRLAWTSWQHPNLPWDGCELWVAEVGPGLDVRSPREFAGGPEESIFQPRWDGLGRLHFVSDRSGWWNLYRLDGDEAVPLAPTEAEFGVPQWVFGLSTYGFLADGRVAGMFTKDGLDYLYVLDDGVVRSVECGFPSLRSASVQTRGNEILTVASGPGRPPRLIAVDADSGEVRTLYRPPVEESPDGYVSQPVPVEFPSRDGGVSHALYYAPKNPEFEGPPGQRPPLVVASHGGPTSQVTPAFDPEIDFFTSRGVAVVDVNYGGSTGYGREYMLRLRRQWGVVDVEDCIDAALYLAGREDVDAERLAIRGGSAGGYTTLAALTFHDVFRGGANYYGLSELEAFVHDTHKFESRYLDSLVGPWPESKDVYYERSPLHFFDRLTCPVIVFQGLEDAVVPPSQSEMIIEALRAKGIECEYHPYEGEQHGFRKAENIAASLTAELGFYGRLFGFEPR